MANKGTSTIMTVSTAAPVMTWSVMRRRKAIGATVFSAEVLPASGIGPRRLAASDRPDQQTSESVDYDRDQEQRQTDLDQSGKVDVSGGLAKLIREHAGHGIAGGEQRLRDLRTVAYHHGHGHGFSQSAS